MGKKRKSVATSLDEVDRTMYATFCSAANSLSHLYTQTMNQQKLSFQAGERDGLEKLYQWILRQQEGGSRVTIVDVLNYLQNELDYCGEEPTMSPQAPVAPPIAHQHIQQAMQIPSSDFLVSSGSSAETNAGHGHRPEHCDQQPKSLAISNALSSPFRYSLQNYHFTQGGNCPNGSALVGNGVRDVDSNVIHHQNRHSNPLCSNDSMDMHADSSGHESGY